MGLMSKIANSRAGKIGGAIVGSGAVFVPTYEMLNPTVVYAEQSISEQRKYSQLIENIKKGESFPLKLKSAGVDTSLVCYKRSGYNPELGFVNFSFYPIREGVLETRIRNTPYAGQDVNPSEKGLSKHCELVIVDGGEEYIDGKPELVLVNETILVSTGEKPSEETPILGETIQRELVEYKKDPKTKRGIDMEYIIALTRTNFNIGER